MMKGKRSWLFAAAATMLGFAMLLSACKPEDAGRKTTLTLNRGVLTLNVGATFQLVADTNSTDKVEWSSSDTAIATVAEGLVTGVAKGRATVTAKCGSLSKDCVVTVEQVDNDTVRLDNSSMELVEGSNRTLTASVYRGDDAIQKAVEWTFELVGGAGSADTVVTHSIDSTTRVCTLSAVKKGEIKVTAKVGASSAVCRVKVIKENEQDPEAFRITISKDTENYGILFNGFKLCKDTYRLYVDGTERSDAQIVERDGTYSVDFTNVLTRSGVYAVKVGYRYNDQQYFSNELTFDTGIAGANEINSFECEMPGALWSTNTFQNAYATDKTLNSDSKKSVKITVSETNVDNQMVIFNRSGREWGKIAAIRFWLYVDSASFEYKGSEDVTGQKAWPAQRPGAAGFNDAIHALLFQRDKTIKLTGGELQADQWFQITLENPEITIDQGVQAIKFISENNSWFVNDGNTQVGGVSNWKYSFYLDEVYAIYETDASVNGSTLSFDEEIARNGESFGLENADGTKIATSVAIVPGADLSQIFTAAGEHSFRLVLYNGEGEKMAVSQLLTYTAADA